MYRVYANISQWYRGVAQSSLYDAVSRLPAIFYFALLLSVQMGQLVRDLVATTRDGDAMALSSILARLAVAALIVTMASLTIQRHRPVARAEGLMPRLTAVLGSVFFFAIVLLPRAEPDMTFDIASLVLIAAGNIATLAVVTTLGRSFSTMAEARSLVVTGPYRFVRHPLYAAEQIALVGMFLQYRSLPAAALLVAQMGLQLKRMANEEAVLETAFPEYTEYRRHTARILPGIY